MPPYLQPALQLALLLIHELVLVRAHKDHILRDHQAQHAIVVLTVSQVLPAILRSKPGMGPIPADRTLTFLPPSRLCGRVLLLPYFLPYYPPPSRLHAFLFPSADPLSPTCRRSRGCAS